MVLFRGLSPLKRQKIKFILAGIINTSFGYTVYAAMIFYGVPSLLSLLVATILGIAFNFFSFSHLVFSGIRGRWIFLRFIFSYSAVYVVNAIMLIALINVGHINPYLSQVICMPISVFLSWALMHGWVYRE